MKLRELETQKANFEKNFPTHSMKSAGKDCFYKKTIKQL